MSSGSPDTKDNEGGRLGGARADFVASLGRKVNDARDLLAALEDDPASKHARDELRRRLHALGAGARLLRFDAMAKSLAEALAVLDRGAQLGALREEDVSFLGQVLDDLPALAWGEAPPRVAPPPAPRARGDVTEGLAEGDEADDPHELVEPRGEAAGALPTSVLVVGDAALADALTDDTALRARTFECERTEDARSALELARAFAPDVMLVDADVPNASDLVEALLDDPLTEPVPIIVVGQFRAPDEAARFVALGVAKALTKPVPPEALRRTCDELLDARDGRTMRVTLGEPTLEQLAGRLAEELKRALVDSVDRPARSCRVPLGEGTEVLGALWGAIARVQEIVTQKTAGAVRFGGDAPEGAIALAPWLHQDLAAGDRMAGRGRGAAADVRLQGRRVVVADDDPGVTWFIADLLRTAGCEVHEALDGAAALDIAFRVQPELIVSDILMPGMDGFALSRALHRDVALRDTPVILLSWKEDLLQRVRELGASAAAYMRKESDSRAILARVREVLRPRARIEMRLRGDGEVRGRLDELTPRLLLELVGAIRRNARVAVRDASHLYEIDIRDGAPRRATRTASDGAFQSGERALASLLGVGAGRFVVSSSQEPVKGELTGTLYEQLARPVAAARGALAATTGARTMHVERILLDEGVLEEYLRATPDPARSILRRLGRGASPRQMVLAGEVSPSLLEDLLSDLATRSAVRAVEGPNGADFLTPAVEAALSVLRGAPRPGRSLPPNARPSVPAPPVLMRARAASDAFAAEIKSPVPAPPYETLSLSEPPPASRAGAALDADDGAPSSLEDAVMREISERSPDPGAARASKPASNPPPIVEPSALRKRSSNPPAVEPSRHDPDSAQERALLPSIPPDAVVPGATSSEEVLAAPVSMPHSGGTRAASEPQAPAAPVAVTAPAAPPERGDAAGPAPGPGVTTAPAPTPPPVRAVTPTPSIEVTVEPDHDTDVDGIYVSPFAPATQPIPVAAGGEKREAAAAPTPSAPRASGAEAKTTPSSARAPTPAPAPARAPAPTPTPAAAPTATGRSPGLLVLVFLALGVAVGGVLYVSSNESAEPAPAGAPTASAPAAATAAPAPSPSAAAPGTALAAPSATATASSPAPVVPASAGAAGSGSTAAAGGEPAAAPAGSGVVEISAPAGARVRIDGKVVGTGPLVSAPVSAGYHDLRVEHAGKDTKQVLEVRAGKTTRVKATLPP